LDVEKILKEWRKNFKCSGNIADGKNEGDKIVKLQGDHREAIKAFLIEEEIATKEQIRILN
jgi:translation initiation factor 1